MLGYLPKHKNALNFVKRSANLMDFIKMILNQSDIIISDDHLERYLEAKMQI